MFSQIWGGLWFPVGSHLQTSFYALDLLLITCLIFRYNILNIYVNTYHNKLNDMMKEFSINGEKIPMQKVLLIGT
jgi:hypothetical protein